MKRLRLPIGKDSFIKIRDNQLYYIDKTKIIEDLWNDNFEIILFTRPRRFGKTIMMQMLSSFFDIQKDNRKYFEGLYISEKKEICEEWMNQYPVLSLTLKDVSGKDFQDAEEGFRTLISECLEKYIFLTTSKKLTDNDKALCKRLYAKTASERETKDSIYSLLSMLNKHYGKPAILIIDEYDVPLAKAEERGYYDDMMELVRGLFSKSIKNNPNLKFAIITGCLRVAKESIFTGAKNFKCNTVSSLTYSDYFGFTETEVDKILTDAECMEKKPEIREWYNGYLFGKKDMYCPWDVVNCVDDLYHDYDMRMKCYWKNTSHNAIIRRFIDRASMKVKRQIEDLINGGTITVTILEDLSYDLLTCSEDNIWSILYMTGYLTMAKAHKETRINELPLIIPNLEVKTIYEDMVIRWFDEGMKKADNTKLFEAFWSGDAKTASDAVSDILFTTISYFDYKEDYYHAFLGGIFIGKGYDVQSNKEMGKGRPDLYVADTVHRRALVIEVKHTKDENEVYSLVEEALSQIETGKYLEGINKGFKEKIAYAAVFCEKSCMIVKKT